MRDARLAGWITWLAVGVFGYLTNVRFFEVIAGVGLGISLFWEAVALLRGLPHRDRQR